MEHRLPKACCPLHVMRYVGGNVPTATRFVRWAVANVLASLLGSCQLTAAAQAGLKGPQCRPTWTIAWWPTS